jgi:hypothetical protein
MQRNNKVFYRPILSFRVRRENMFIVLFEKADIVASACGMLAHDKQRWFDMYGKIAGSPWGKHIQVYAS